jgi:hypothetical protein
MSTFAVRAPHAPKLASPLRGLARAASVALMLIDVFADAQRLAYEAKQRYPFIEG